MLLGELFEKRNVLEEQIKDIKDYLNNKIDLGPDSKIILDVLYSCSFDYETCKSNINNIINKVELVTADDKKTFLSNLFILKGAMMERIESTTYLIRNKCVDNDTFINLIKQKKEYIKEYLYINSFINKTIWSITIDNQGMG